MPAQGGQTWRRRPCVIASLMLIGGLLLCTWPVQAQMRVTILPPRAHVGDARRLALVIGNGAYRNVTSLKNPVNDASAIAAKLQAVGYEVRFSRDLDRRDMNEVISDFLSGIEPGNEVLVYYAGHGVELQGSNYLLPVDVPRLGLEQERLLRSEAINLTELLMDLEARSARVSLVILDACRDNPFQVPGSTRSIGEKRGLGRVDPPQGSFVIFSAGVGEGALDNLGDNDRDPNGLFTRKLLQLITIEGIELRTMVRQLRAEVREAALAAGGQAQVPSYYDQLLGDFFFIPKAGPKQTPCDLLVKSDATRDTILVSDLEPAFKACSQAVSEYPSESRFVHLLYNVQEQKAAQRALRSDEPGPSEAYMALFPTGRLVADVNAHLAEVAATKAQAAKAQAALAEATKVEAVRAAAVAEAARAASAIDAAKAAAAKQPGASDTAATVTMNTPPAQSPAPIAGPTLPIDPADLARLLQVHLKRVGCDPGPVEGQWNAGSRRALEAFNTYAGTKVNVKTASLDALDAVRARTSRVCPLVCDRLSRAEGDRCVRIACDSGFALNAAGQCEKRKERPKPPVARHDAPSATRGGGGKCFSFNGRQFCE
jgi:Caspase domain